MASSEEFPRTLFVTSHAFNHVNGGGVTFSNLFSGWPKERLACVHNDPIEPKRDVCDNYYWLGKGELRKWGPIRFMQSDPPALLNGDQSEEPSPSFAPQQLGVFKGVRSCLFGENEIPEVAVLSSELETWIEAFRPQVLYTILGSNGLMDLIELIRVRFDLPLVVHIMDDWRTKSHTRGILAPARRRKMHRLMEHFFEVADQRMGISDAMCRAYKKEYGHPFLTFHNGVEATLAEASTGGALKSHHPFKIFYAGAVLPFAQLQSITDVCEAVSHLQEQGGGVEFDIYCPSSMVDAYREQLLTCDAIRLLPPVPSREDYFTEMRNADLLLLPVNFNEETISFIRYSMPTKVSEMMQTGVPVLVYGPAGVAQVDYAMSEAWGYALTERSVNRLVEAITHLRTDAPLRKRLVARAQTLSRERHDIKAIRTQFRAALADAAHGK